MLDKNIGGTIVKYFKIIVVGGLCASLILNFTLLSKLDDIDNKMNNLSNYQQQVVNTVNAQVSQINNTINQIKEEQSWLSAINVETTMDESDKSKAMVNFEWQVKELQNNSEVLFNYKKNEENDYHSIEAIDLENGFFRVVMPVEVTLEPVWNSYIFDRGSHSNIEPVRVMEGRKEAYESLNQLSFDYYISVSHDDMIKSAEINTVRIEDMGARYFGYLEVRTDIDKNNNYNMSLISGKMYNTSIYLKEVYLEKFRNGQLVETEKIEERSIAYEGGMPAREDTNEFYKQTSEEKLDYSSLVLKVIYSDGSVFEREIYSE
jgi:ribosomal protein S8